MSIIAREGVGRFGVYGGQFVPETLMPGLRELEQAYAELGDGTFIKDR